MSLSVPGDLGAHPGSVGLLVEQHWTTRGEGLLCHAVHSCEECGCKEECNPMELTPLTIVSVYLAILGIKHTVFKQKLQVQSAQ